MSPGTGRWCPTSEQLMMLEEMYKGGMRTPNATQIQQITAHLSNYGTIQGKNVFYWFQNHKARDRHRLRIRNHHHHHFHKQHLLSTPPPPFYNTFHPQEVLVDQCLSAAMVKPEVDNGDDEKKEMEMRRFKQKQTAEWKMMRVQVPYCTTNINTNRPLKTLQLFPLTATNLGECK